MRLEIVYETTYQYAPPVRSGLTVLRLRPVPRLDLDVVHSHISVTPGYLTSSYIDGWGSQVDLIETREIHSKMTFRMDAVVETIPRRIQAALSPMEGEVFRAQSDRTPFSEVDSLGWTIGDEGRSWTAVEALLGWIPQRFLYQVGTTDAETTLEQLLSQGAGVCQDFAHLYIALLRRWGWPARYVSGYFFSAGPGAERIEAEAMHAWVEVYREGTGWIALDATTGEYADSRYVPVGYGRDYNDVSPVRGMLQGGTQQVQVSRLEMVQGQAQQ